MSYAVLPNLRVARPHHVEAVSGRAVFAGPDGTLLCEHGECASTISTWVAMEAAARLKGDAVPNRSSACTCQSTTGLHVSTDTPRVASEDISIFDTLSTQPAAAEYIASGRVYRHVPGSGLYIDRSGHVVCKHGRRASLLARHRAAPKTNPLGGGKCDCVIHVPRRTRQKCVVIKSLCPV